MFFFRTVDDRKYDYNRDRDNDTPDTIVSSSSPECIMPEMPSMFPGLFHLSFKFSI